ncbi:MAG: UDP-N-acetylmuramoyl-tripeptide--D-alanyl-D-alanine ligase [Parcubacteria bacterium C7867-003]|nr:MAG: UDP-N-acetylmuramoyl-tripeptide--D-alanyl-D-alanine ligase [Parcubacteria bacterium C7867-003]
MSLLKKIVVALLILESRLILRTYKPFVVAVTGSVGKTSTKDAIFAVLKSPKVCSDQHMCYVRKSEKSLNSEIGLPLSIIGAPNSWHSIIGWTRTLAQGLKLILMKHEYPDCLVLEVGADHPGDIKKVAPWLRPNIAVITRISRTPVHVEFFPSPEHVFEEKISLALAVRNEGTVVLFGDDEKTLSVKKVLDQSTKKQRNIITYGISEGVDVRGTQKKIIYEDQERYPVGMQFIAEYKGLQIPVKMLGGLGTPYMYTLLAAVAVGQAQGLTADLIGRALHEYEVPPGRMNIIMGINGSTLIDDTYNSSPDAVASALETLTEITASGTKIAVLGDMMELGQYASEEHRTVGKHVATVVGRLVTVGQRSRLTAQEALANGMSSDKVSSFDTAEEAAAFLVPFITRGDIVLVKGSQSVRMEKITKALLHEPDRAGELLVRQEKEWLEKK